MTDKYSTTATDLCPHVETSGYAAGREETWKKYNDVGPLKPIRVVENYGSCPGPGCQAVEVRDPVDDMSCDMSAITWDGSAMMMGARKEPSYNPFMPKQDSYINFVTKSMMTAIRDDTEEERHAIETKEEVNALVPITGFDSNRGSKSMMGDASDSNEEYRKALETKTQNKMEAQMLRIANKQLNDNKIFETFCASGSTIDNTVFLLASTLVSNNRYIFDLLSETGWLSPNVEKTALSLMDHVASQSNLLCDLLLGVRQSTGEATKTSVIACVNDIIAGSNQLSKVIDIGCQSEPVAANTTTEGRQVSNSQNDGVKSTVSSSMLYGMIPKGRQISAAFSKYFNKAVDHQRRSLIEKSNQIFPSSLVTDIMSMRNQISVALQEYFQKVVKNEKTAPSIPSEICGSDELTETIRLLADPEQLSGFLRPHTLRSSVPRENTDPCFLGIETCDSMAAASSFLDFIDTSRLSLIFDEDEEEGVEIEKNGVVTQENTSPKVNLDRIFKRINLVLPKNGKKDKEIIRTSPKTSKRENGTPITKKSEKRSSRKEARRQKIIQRRIAQQEKKEKKKKEEETRKTSKRLSRTMAEI